MGEHGPIISRRDFLKVSGAGIAGLFVPRLPTRNSLSPEIDSTNDQTVSAVMTDSAVANAIQLFEGKPYDWNTGAHCSSFAARVVSRFGYPSGDLNSTDTKRFPGSGTTMQREWLRELDKSLLLLSGRQFGSNVLMEQMLKPDYWEDKRPGSLVYLATAESHNGYNEVSHVAVFIGMSNNEPLFAEFGPKMFNGPQTKRTLDQLSAMYAHTGDGKLDLKPYDTGSSQPDQLVGYVWDTIGAAREMWREGGPVVPEGSIVADLESSAAITVNTNEGTIGYWRMYHGQTELVPIHSVDSPYAYAAIGRRLRRNSTSSTINYYNAGMGKDGSQYDATTGVWYSQKGCPRRTLTPPLTILLKDIVWIGNFGNIGGQTHILLGQPAEVSKGEILTSPTGYNSSYTLHEVPRNTGIQEILLREPIIRKANMEGHPLQMPFLSSGCVNLDAATWQKIVALTREDLSIRPVFLLFSVPGFPLDLTMQKDFFQGVDPFGYRSTLWEYKGTEVSEQTPIVRPPVTTDKDQEKENMGKMKGRCIRY